ncbi:hypothetical protein [Lentzea flava]|uniref:DNA-binding transcriptional regulator, MarR family n=1 Tax=Lentzea flava TaxID=103732 RepID=A0ABQ2UF53_9PSEU|nr:hypothetical protein [Lentzea flava]MCP2198658.1 hypothetical protein [Lentzea flava]GGU29173.1 hypothetical protein GCM10010178_21680 [Lentzea flava]
MLEEVDERFGIVPYEIARDTTSQLVLVAMLDEPWGWWNVATLAAKLKMSMPDVRESVNSLVQVSVVERMSFELVRTEYKGRAFCVAPFGLRAARWMIRANFDALHPLAAQLGLSVRRALGFGSILDGCSCDCGRCCCGLPGPSTVESVTHRLKR